MNFTLTTSRIVLVAAAASLVTVGCGGGGSSPPSASTVSSTTPDTGGNGATGPTTPSPAPAPGAPAKHAKHSHCGWIGGDTFAVGKAAFLANPDYYDAVHPYWGTLNPDGMSVKTFPFSDDADMLRVAKEHHVRMMPIIDYGDPAYLRAVMVSPQTIQAHAQMIASFVVQHGWDGVELDYEHLWQASDKPGYTAIVTAISDLLHAQGKEVSLSLPSLDHAYTDSGYDYPELQKHADALHLMGYDYHGVGSPHLGPIAPKGWISDVVGYVESLGQPDKWILGIANYGVGSGWYTDAVDANKRCLPGTFSEQTDHMNVCNIGHQEAGIAPHCTTAQGDVWFENLDSMKEKAGLAKAHHLGGIALYSIGDEPDGFLDAIDSLFPN